MAARPRTQTAVTHLLVTRIQARTALEHAIASYERVLRSTGKSVDDDPAIVRAREMIAKRVTLRAA